MTPERIAWTSASLFLLPVMKFRTVGMLEGEIMSVVESVAPEFLIVRLDESWCYGDR